MKPYTTPTETRESHDNNPPPSLKSCISYDHVRVQMNATEKHAALIEAGWRCRVDGRWISPDPADARSAFSFTAAWAQHCEHDDRRGQ